MQGVSPKDVFHVRLRMSREEIDAYATTGFVRNGELCKQPPGVEIIFFPRHPWDDPEVNSVWYCTPNNPDPACKKTGKDIEAELAKLVVVQDAIKGHYKGMVEHPWIKIETIDLNPELDYNRGELDFLRSGPVNPRKQYLSAEQLDLVNAHLERTQKKDKETFAVPKKLEKGKPFKDEFTGITFYEYNIIQVTEGGGEEEHAQEEVRAISSKSVEPHYQYAGVGKNSIKRWWENEVSKEPVSINGGGS